MLTHLRLARARGSLTAPNSVVQDEALTILDMVDERERERERVDMVRALIATVGPEGEERVVAQFGEYFPEEQDPFVGAYDEEGNFDIDKVDDSSVPWRTPVSPDEDEALSAWIEQQEQANGEVTLTANDWV